jgi:hypothetical protein
VRTARLKSSATVALRLKTRPCDLKKRKPGHAAVGFLMAPSPHWYLTALPLNSPLIFSDPHHISSQFARLSSSFKSAGRLAHAGDLISIVQRELEALLPAPSSNLQSSRPVLHSPACMRWIHHTYSFFICPCFSLFWSVFPEISSRIWWWDWYQPTPYWRFAT